MNFKSSVWASIAVLILGIEVHATETIALTRQDHGDEQQASSGAGVASEIDETFGRSSSDLDEHTNLTVTSYAHAEHFVDYGNGDTAYANGTNLTTSYTNTSPSSSTYDANIGVDTAGLVTGGTTGYGGMPHGGAEGHGISIATFNVGTPTDPEAVMVLSGTIELNFDSTADCDGAYVYASVGSSYVYIDAYGMSGFLQNAYGDAEYFEDEEGGGGIFPFSFIVDVDDEVYTEAGCGYLLGVFFPPTDSQWPEMNAFAAFSVTADSTTRLAACFSGLRQTQAIHPRRHTDMANPRNDECAARSLIVIGLCSL